MIVAGIGLKSGATAEEILACVDAALAASGLAGASIARLATILSRAQEAGVIAAAAERGAELTGAPIDILRRYASACATRSDRALALYGVGSVAETAALAASAPNGRLAAPRIAVGSVTCALAISDAVSRTAT